jgi:ComEC/Rec2-related protein
MASVMIAAFLFEKKQYTLQSLGIAGTVILFLSPSTLFTPGFQLSFAATAGIIALYPRLAKVRCEFGSPFLRTLINHLLSSFYVSLCGFLFTAPVLLYHFGSISLFGLVSNIAAVMIMTSAMWIFFISLLLQAIIPSLVLFSGKIISLHFDALFSIADLAKMVSFSEIQLPVPGAFITLLYLAVLIGVATARKTHLIKFLTLAVPLFIIISSVLLSIDFLSNKIRILQYRDTYSSWVSVRWPQGNVWLVNYKVSPRGKLFQDQIVSQWIRHYPWSHLNKVFFCETKPSTNIEQLGQYDCEDIEIIHIKDSIVSNISVNQGVKKQSYKCLLFQNPSPIQLSIFSCFDTTMFNQPELTNNDKVVLLTTIH